MSIPLVSYCGASNHYHSAMNKDLHPWHGWGERLKTHLEQRDENLAKLSEKMTNRDGDPMAESTLRSWTNGTRKINLVDFIRLCSAAQADPALILFGRPLVPKGAADHLSALVTSLRAAEPLIPMYHPENERKPQRKALSRPNSKPSKARTHS